MNAKEKFIIELFEKVTLDSAYYPLTDFNCENVIDKKNVKYLYLNYQLKSDSIDYLNELFSNDKDKFLNRIKKYDYFLIPKFCFYGDYNNTSLIEKSNFIYIKENFGKLKGVKFIYGQYDFNAIAIRLKDIPDKNLKHYYELIKTLSGLSDYPILDEMMYSELEYNEKINAIYDDMVYYHFIYKMDITDTKTKNNIDYKRFCELLTEKIFNSNIDDEYFYFDNLYYTINEEKVEIFFNDILKTMINEKLVSL